MRRTALPALLIGMALLVAGPLRASADGMDVLVMVDTSESMFPYFDNLVQYLIRDLLEERLRPGDSFHLLSFASEPEIELGVGIDDNLSVEKVIGRILLLQPLGKYTDLVSAVQFLYTYVKVLPQKNKKTILLLTDGIHDPPPGSPYFGWSPEQVHEELLASAREIQREGWSVHILQVPGDIAAAAALTGAAAEPAAGASPAGGGKPGGGAAASGAGGAASGTGAAGSVGPGSAAGEGAVGTDAAAVAAGAAGAATGQSLLDELARTLDTKVVPYDDAAPEAVSSLTTGLPLLRFPQELGRVGRVFTAPFTVRNFKDEPILLKLEGVRTEAAGGRKIDLLAGPVSVTVPAGGEATIRAPIRLPSGLADGENSLPVELLFSDSSERISPRHGELRFTYSQGILAGRFLLVGLLSVLLAAVLVFVLIRLVLAIRLRIETRPAAPFRRALEAEAAARPEERTILMSVFYREMKLADKAVQPLRPGSPRSVGGPGSAFAVRSLPLPRRIADLSLDGGRVVLRPRRADCFPAGEAAVEGCLDRPIEVVNPKGQKLHLHFQDYVSPLLEINRLMLSIRRPDIQVPPPPPPRPAAQPVRRERRSGADRRAGNAKRAGAAGPAGKAEAGKKEKPAGKTRRSRMAEKTGAD